MGAIRDLFASSDEDDPKEEGSLAGFFSLFTEPPDPNDPNRPQEVEPIEPSSFRVFEEDRLFWALHDLPLSTASHHFAVCGAIGSGKTTIIELFLQSIAQRFRAGRTPPEQLIVFDAKGDMIQTLAGFGFKPDDENVYILNPFDNRAASWAIAEEITDASMARHIAALLVPEEKASSAPYFWTAARQLLLATILGLKVTLNEHWTLRDLLCATDSLERIKAVTGRDQLAARLAAPILKDQRHAFGVLSTLSNKLGIYSEVAALWHTSRNRKKFSVPQFLSRSGILVLPFDPVLKESLWPINAILLRSLASHILRLPETKVPRHWCVFDEFSLMGQMDSIRDLLNLGRSKGVSVTLGFQTIELLSVIYPEKAADAIISQCSTKTVLRAGGEITASWASKHFNNIREYEDVVTDSWGPGGSSRSIQYKLTERSIFTPAYFLNLSSPGPGQPFQGVSDIPSLRVSLVHDRPFDDLLAWRELKPKAKISGFEPREDSTDQSLKPWTKEEELAFCGQNFDEERKDAKSESTKDGPPAGSTKPNVTRKDRFPDKKKPEP